MENNNPQPIIDDSRWLFIDSSRITPATRLSEHFTLGEMIASGTARQYEIDNMPTPDIIDNLRELCINVLEPVRRRFGVTRITSAYRCEELNRRLGGAKNSQHMRGEAADIHIAGREEGMKIFEFIRDNVVFDQLLFENIMTNGCCWLHVSYTTRRINRRMAKEMNLEYAMTDEPEIEFPVVYPFDTADTGYNPFDVKNDGYNPFGTDYYNTVITC